MRQVSVARVGDEVGAEAFGQGDHSRVLLFPAPAVFALPGGPDAAAVAAAAARSVEGNEEKGQGAAHNLRAVLAKFVRHLFSGMVIDSHGKGFFGI